MKKLMVSGALALALSTSALVAEESGAFVGLEMGVAGLSKMSQDITSIALNMNMNTMATNSLRYGIVGGYKWFFTPTVGLRAYLQVNNGTSYLQDASTSQTIGGVFTTPAGNQFNTLNVFANVDFLNTFYNSEAVSAGWFAGLSLGAGIHNGGIVKDFTQDTNISSITGFDLGINLGLRTMFGKHQGLEFYTRLGVLSTQATMEQNGVPASVLSVKANINQIYNAGVRYTYNF